MDIKRGDRVYILKGALRRYSDVVRDEEKKKEAEKNKPEETGALKRVGKVLHVDRKKNTVMVEGFNIVLRRSKPTQKNPQGGIVTKEAPIHRSRVALYSDELGGPTKIGTKVTVGADGKTVRTRICKKTGNEI